MLELGRLVVQLRARGCEVVLRGAAQEAAKDAVDLGFDPSADFHVYTIEWTPAGASFLVVTARRSFHGRRSE
jgi:hypothetical protein